MVRQNRPCDGRGLWGMFLAATACLEREMEAIDALNVFPVPDGDTGTNMLLTMRSTLEAVGSAEAGAGEVMAAMAHGALMGARGNSGVILSQILRGLARVMERKDVFGGSDFAAALEEASATAYRGVSHPVEGTMLTVVREAAEAAAAAARNDGGLALVMEATVTAAKAAVAKTPSLLDVLREAGVVDAGGQGLYVMFEGMLGYLMGEEMVATVAPGASRPALAAAPTLAPAVEGQNYGYCTNFLIVGRNMPLDEVRLRIEAMGESALVVGNTSTIRVHVHTFDPGAALSYGSSLGTLRNIKVDNIDEQHQDFLALQATPRPSISMVTTVVVVSGQGLSEVFASLGAGAIVPGGMTMNPSAQELLRAIEEAPAAGVIVLPNNENVILAAQQAQALAMKTVRVVPTRSIPQGVAAQLAFNGAASLESNVSVMEEAMASVQTAAVTTAVRSGLIGDIVFAEGDYIGLAEEELVAVGNSSTAVVEKLLARWDAEEAELLTLYHGAAVPKHQAEEVAALVKAAYPRLEVELVDGGQPHYDYILSLE